jgi:hypothetical protein
MKCRVEVYIDAETLTAELCDAVEAGLWANLTDLAWFGRNSSAARDAPTRQALAHIARVLRAIGPQLTHLRLSDFNAEVLEALATCTRLTGIEVDALHSTVEEMIDFCLVLSEIRAPLRVLKAVHFDAASSYAAVLLESLPTVVEAYIPGVDLCSLRTSVKSRLEAFNLVRANSTMPRIRDLRWSHRWTPSTFVQSLHADMTDPVPIADIAANYPNLRRLRFSRLRDDVSVDDLVLPSSLEQLYASPFPASCTRLVRRLGGLDGSARLSNLAELTLSHTSADGGEETVDLDPLVAACSASLRSLTIDVPPTALPMWSAPDIASIASTVSQLVALECVRIKLLPNARCFLGGRHTRLRTLVIGCIHAPGDEAPFAALLKACPRLVSASGTVAFPDPGPPGFAVTVKDDMSLTACRVSFPTG